MYNGLMRKLSLSLALAAITFASGLAQTDPPSAVAVLTKARTAAAKSGKMVFVSFHASWCGWCHKMEDFMNLPQFKPLFEKSYEFVALTVMENGDKKALENAGALEVMEANGGKNQGIPFFYITDAKGKMIVNSKRVDDKKKDGQNIGHPAAPEEVAHFMMMLKKTSKMTPAELSSIETWLKNQKIG